MEKVFDTAFDWDACEWLQDSLPLEVTKHPREGNLHKGGRRRIKAPP
jgi:hypothetical protein